MNSSEDQKIVLGSITGLFGIRGWVKIFSETDPRENIVSYSRWSLKKGNITTPANASPENADPWRQIEVLEGRRQGKTVIARLAGIETPEAAEGLIGHVIAVDRSELPALGTDEFYWTDLIGLAVINQHDQQMGYVDRLFSTGANDVLVVATGGKPAGKGDPAAEILIPWILESVILDVDHAARRISVDWEFDY